MPVPFQFRSLLEGALREDVGSGDITTGLTIPHEKRGEAVIVAKAHGVVAGMEVAAEVFALVDKELRFHRLVNDGSAVGPGQELARIEGRLWAILVAERVALNFLQHLSGVATMTRRFVERLAGLDCRLVDTRKTTPGLRALEKYAVRVGGGRNHRFGLYDGILIKDNHIAACGSVGEAVRRCKAGAPHGLLVEVEVTSLEQIGEAIAAGADALLLDNMEPHTLRKAVEEARRLNGSILLEASGGVTLDNVREVAETGVDIISSGALTHSAKALDLSLRVTA